MRITVKDIIKESIAACLIVPYMLWMMVYEKFKKPLLEEIGED